MSRKLTSTELQNVLYSYMLFRGLDCMGVI